VETSRSPYVLDPERLAVARANLAERLAHAPPVPAPPPRRPAVPKWGHVYFLATATHVKIGATRDVGARLRELQIPGAAPVDVVGVIASAAAVYRERDRVHRMFEPLRDRGEWFRRAPELDAWIANHTSRPEPAILRRRPRRRHA
jgi:hypothetical protein